MENVPGMQTVRRDDRSFLEAAAAMLRERGGYRTEVWRLTAAAFGVPQERVRCFLVASRLPLMPARPPEEYQDTRRADADLDALPPVTLGEAIFDLPERAAGTGVSVDEREPPDLADPRFRRYLGKFGIVRPSRLLYQHTVRYHNPRDLELYALLRPGEDSIHALEQHGRADLMRYRRDVFDDKYARLRGDRPCKTIVAHLAKDGNGYIHPTQVRSISLREAARVQSFHDGYLFCGSPSEQWVQLGNAVAPVLAEAIARSFRRTLERS
jgi:DNA (cytosine-5)-methyltransferase 1